ncbi:MAG TPA: glycosyltransferase N-terminal domain-containing protein [Chitinophagaceae bacterium]|nr:glycosyltransferase N-terminal domain-containing protein [Chitinophagaceae bacterium]
MTVFLYNIFLIIYRIAVRIASTWSKKARLWLEGRKNIFDKIISATKTNHGKIIWMHCSSLGEFEQGRPLLEKMKIEYPGIHILLTFFSPSGYEAQKNYKGADWVFYLPMDSPANAKKFVTIINPRMAIIVKYDYWYYYVKAIKEKGIPLLLISALFSQDTAFFKWYGRLQRKMLRCFTHFFVQNDESKKLLGSLGYSNVTVAGDTRFDRVIEIAEQWEPIPAIEQFIGNSKAIVAGSTWPEDEEVLQKVFASLPDKSLKLIIAPHDISEKNIGSIKELFPKAILFSELKTGNLPTGQAGQQPVTSNCLIIDNIGMLSRLYKYGYVTYVGGGLRTMGVHNVLEAAVYHRIVLFGDYFRKYTEAVELVLSAGGIPFTDVKRDGMMLKELIEALLANNEEYNYRSKAAGDFVQSNKGATQKILQYIQEKRLLTS